MTDNEQRAHDLSVALTMWKLDHIKETLRKEDADENGRITKRVDVYALYKGDYENFLKNLNRDYPDIIVDEDAE